MMRADENYKPDWYQRWPEDMIPVFYAFMDTLTEAGINTYGNGRFDADVDINGLKTVSKYQPDARYDGVPADPITRYVDPGTGELILSVMPYQTGGLDMLSSEDPLYDEPNLYHPATGFKAWWMEKGVFTYPSFSEKPTMEIAGKIRSDMEPALTELRPFTKHPHPGDVEWTDGRRAIVQDGELPTFITINHEDDGWYIGSSSESYDPNDLYAYDGPLATLHDARQNIELEYRSWYGDGEQ